MWPDWGLPPECRGGRVSERITEGVIGYFNAKCEVYDGSRRNLEWLIRQ